MVGLQLVPVAGSADALKVLAPAGVAEVQSADQPGRNDVVDVASRAR